MAALGLCCCTGASHGGGSLVVEHGPWSAWAWVVVACQLSS